MPAERRFGAPERTGPKASLRALDDPAAARRRRRRAASPSPSRSACCTATATPRTSSRRRGAARTDAGRARVALARGRGDVPRVRAGGDDRARRRPLPPARRLPRALRAAPGRGLPAPAIMQSCGGLATLDRPRAHAALTVLTGPAGGAAGAAWAAPAAGRARRAVLRHGRDVVRRLRDRGRRRARDRRPARRRAPARAADARPPHRRRRRRLDRLARPGRRAAGRPASAGAGPGPPPTATAAPSRRSPTRTSCSACSARTRRSRARSRSTARRPSAPSRRCRPQLGLELRECAAGIVRVANAEMVRALRVMTVERGVDPREFALLAFGGAGPLHAAAIAEELGMTRILCPRASGVLAALGLVVSDRRRDAQRSVLLDGRGADRRGAARRDRARWPSGPARASGASPPSCATGASRSSWPSSAARRRSPTRCARRSPPPTRSATATATRTARSSS